MFNKKETVYAIIIVVMVLFCIAVVCNGDKVKASQEANHPVMACDFVYFNDDSEQKILRRCYDEQEDNICYISEYLSAISCVPNHTGAGPIVR